MQWILDDGCGVKYYYYTYYILNWSSTQHCNIFVCSRGCSPVSADHDQFPLVVICVVRRPGGQEAGGEENTKDLQETHSYTAQLHPVQVIVEIS